MSASEDQKTAAIGRLISAAVKGVATRRTRNEVTADRLRDVLDTYRGHFDGKDRDDISHVIDLLEELPQSP